MRKVTSAIVGFAAVVILIGAIFGLTWLGIEWRGFFGPKRAAVERDVFRETRSYDEGMLQQLSRFRLEHVRAESEAEKSVITSTVRHMFAEYDPARLPTFELRAFLQECCR